MSGDRLTNKMLPPPVRGFVFIVSSTDNITAGRSNMGIVCADFWRRESFKVVDYDRSGAGMDYPEFTYKRQHRRSLPKP